MIPRYSFVDFCLSWDSICIRKMRLYLSASIPPKFIRLSRNDTLEETVSRDEAWLVLHLNLCLGQ